MTEGLILKKKADPHGVFNWSVSSDTAMFRFMVFKACFFFFVVVVFSPTKLISGYSLA